MPRKTNEIQNIFGLSFIDVFANTLGALAFILILVILMIGLRFGLPSINTESLPEAYEGVPYEIWLAAKGGGGDYNWQIIEGELPDGLVMGDTIKGYISGSPKLKDPTTAQEVYQFTALVGMSGDGSNNVDTRSFEIIVNNSRYEQLNILSVSELPKAIKSETYPLMFAASGGRGPYIWRQTSGSVEGLSLNSSGLLEGTVQASPGQYNFQVEVIDQFNQRAQGSFKLEVIEIEEPPEIPDLLVHTDTFPNAIQTRFYQVALAAEGGLSPYTWSGRTSVPGLTVSEDGYLSGTPESIGKSFTVDLTVTSSDGQTNSKNGIFLTVSPAPREQTDPLKITSLERLPEASADTTYAFALAAKGGVPPYEWELADRGDLPGPINLTTDGILTLNTGPHSEYSFSVRVRDDQKQTASKNIQLKVNPAIQPLKFNTEILPKGVEGFPYSLTISAFGGYPPYSWTIEDSTKMVAGISLTADGILSGIPQEAWRGKTTLTVKDVTDAGSSKEFAFEIMESGEGSILPKLEILTDSIPTLMAGEELDLHLATRGGGFPLEWKAEGELPEGISFADGRFSGSPKGTVEPTLVRFSVVDPINQTDSVEIQIGSRSVVDAYWQKIAIISAIVALICILIALLIWWLVRRAKKADLKVLTESVPNARSSFPYKVYLSASGGVPPYTWKVEKGELPMGLELKPEGILEGIPFKGVKLDEIREVNFTVKVTDSIRNSVSQEL